MKRRLLSLSIWHVRDYCWVKAYDADIAIDDACGLVC